MSNSLDITGIIPSLPPCDDGLDTQLSTLIAVGSKLGLERAVGFVRVHIADSQDLAHPSSFERISCPAKHTSYNPADWRCPKCGETELFIIDEVSEEADPDCARLHVDDYCKCDACGYAGSGTSVARILGKQDRVRPCPTCKGKGVVPVV